MINIDERIFSKVTSDEFWLLCHIAKRMNSEMYCFPSNDLMCQDTGWEIKKLQRVKKSLQEKGIIRCEARYSLDRQTTNRYYVTTGLVGLFVGLDILTGSTKKGEVSEKGIPHAPKRDTTPPPQSGITEVLTSKEVLNTNIDANASTELFPTDKDKKEHVPRGTKKEVDTAYTLAVEWWLKQFHPGWSFGAVHGKAVKSILKKIRANLFSAGHVAATPEDVVNVFQIMCRRLPDWFKDKDLPVIDSKYNEVIEQIKNGKGQQQSSRTTSTAWIDELYGSNT